VVHTHEPNPSIAAFVTRRYSSLLKPSFGLDRATLVR